ncbi:MAG: hypothetical protein ACK5RC_07590 [Curvibacter sp.]|jgi:hypothetical protein|nr:hypothetical protein [Curvibacter sp.]
MKTSLRSWLRRHPVLAVIVVHLIAFALLAWMASAFSSAHPDLSPDGSHLRLVPLHGR